MNPAAKAARSSSREPDGPITATATTTCAADYKSEDERKTKANRASGVISFLRVFGYNDNLGWILNMVACLAMIGAGAALPLMDVIFGGFVTVFNDFVGGKLSPDDFMAKVGHFTVNMIQILINITAIRTTKRLRVDFFRHILRQEISFFDSPSSSVSGQITTNGNLINNGISEKLGLIVQAISMFVSAFVVAFIVQWKLTLITLAIVPVNTIITLGGIYIDSIYEYRMFNIYAESGSLAEEAFASIRTAHAFWAFPKLTIRFNRILERARKIGDKKSLIYAILFPVEFFSVIAGYALAFWQGMRMYTSGEIKDPGTVVTVIFAVLVAAQALTQIAPQTIAISQAMAAAQDLFSVINRKSAIDSLSEEGEKIQNFQGDIKLRGVQFSYPSRPGVPVLHGLDLDIPSGKTIALVGASGSGKSTIFGLLERWYAHPAGCITLDGRKLEDINLQWLRTNVRLVQQEPTLFSGTIYQNVADGLTGTGKEDLSADAKSRLVVAACKAAFAHDFVEELPNGYETWIGERGASLSGGQKQRIVIARSIISDPKVLLLDEATSALDPNAEKIVQAALNNVTKGRTTVVIAHRLSTIRDADNIVVMAKGKKIESGTHLELIQQGGTYSRLVQAQDLGKKLESTEDASDGEKDEAIIDMDKEVTRISTTASIHDDAKQAGSKCGLFFGLYLIVKEQRSLWSSFLVILLTCAAGGVTYPILAVLFSKMMEAFQTVDVSKANLVALMFFVVALGNLVLYGVAGWLSNIVAQTVMVFYRGELFNNTLRQDMSFFDKPENGTGALVSRLESEPTSLRDLLSMNISLLIIAIVNLVSSCILALVYGWKLGLVLSFGALPFVVGSGYIRIRLEFRFEDDTVQRFAKSSAVAAEAVMAIRTVSSLALERVIIERYSRELQGIARHAMGSLGYKMFFYSLSQSVSMLSMGLGFWYGAKLLSTGEYTYGQFYVVFIAIVFSGEAAAMLFQWSTSISKAGTAISYIMRLRRNRVLSDADCADAPTEGAAAVKQSCNTPGTEMTFHRVHFAYALRPKHKVLRGIDICIKPGTMVAFVGASGCGKSTMIGLLERFYDPTSGELRANGEDVKTLPRRQYRRDVALVQQEPVLYQGSIGDNISLGMEDGEPSEAHIIEACRSANIWDFVSSLPEGLGTACGKQGLSLSGGQRQRIAIARALIRKPKLLLLDEATSALDTESEKVVKDALDGAAAGRTTIAVAHRLSTIRDADLIAVFAGGSIIELGTHDELVDKKGMYYDMVLGQSLDREAG
ncbi:hypothetical protein E4U41_005495 [Claviceps citrina]|nr:hypothetical protein E4U41_005495 [Claviceps citrina]